MTEDQQLADLRRRLDAVNVQLRDLLQERARLVLEVAAHKRAQGLPLVDVAREQHMLTALLAAPGEGFSRDELQRVLRALLRSYRRLCVRAGQAP